MPMSQHLWERPIPANPCPLLLCLSGSHHNLLGTVEFGPTESLTGDPTRPAGALHALRVHRNFKEGRPAAPIHSVAARLSGLSVQVDACRVGVCVDYQFVRPTRPVSAGVRRTNACVLCCLAPVRTFAYPFHAALLQMWPKKRGFTRRPKGATKEHVWNASTPVVPLTHMAHRR